MYPDIYSLWRGENPREFKLDSGKYPIRDLWKRAGKVWEVLKKNAANGKTSLIVAHNGINQVKIALRISSLLLTLLSPGSPLHDPGFVRRIFQKARVSQLWNR